MTRPPMLTLPRNWQPFATLAALLAAVRAEQKERDAKTAEQPYSDTVAALGPWEPMEVGRAIAAAIRAGSET